jgi:hypothetical protein
MHRVLRSQHENPPKQRQDTTHKYDELLCTKIREFVEVKTSIYDGEEREATLEHGNDEERGVQL